MCECSICLSPISAKTGKVSMACQHSFHFRCITNWFIEQSENDLKETCPYCRREASEDEALPKLGEEDEEFSDDESEVSESEVEFDDETVVEEEEETELIKMADRLCDELRSLDVYNRDIQNKIAEATADETQQGILNRILAYEVDMKEKLEKVLAMEDSQIWCLGASDTIQLMPTDEELQLAAREKEVAEWRAKVEALWPSAPRKRFIFNPEEELELEEEEEEVWQQDQKHNLSLYSLGSPSPPAEDEPTIMIQLKHMPAVFI